MVYTRKKNIHFREIIFLYIVIIISVCAVCTLLYRYTTIHKPGVCWVYSGTP